MLTILSDGSCQVHATAEESSAYLDANLKIGMRYMRYEAYKNDDPGVIEAACQVAKDQLGLSDVYVARLKEALSA